MATTVDAAFTQLLGQQKLTSNQHDVAISRKSGLTTYFANNFEMHDSLFAVGSYDRNTMCSSERDIDFMAIFNAYGQGGYWGRFKGDSRKFLYWVRDDLNDRYAVTKVSSRRICVKLDFTQIVTDVTPGFGRQNGGYLIPNGSGGWMSTNPPFHSQFMSGADHAHSNQLKPIVRLIKWWNIANGRLLQSLHTELLTERVYRGFTMGAVPFTVSEVLRCTPRWLRESISDPWASGTNIDGYLTTENRARAIQLLEADAATAKEAEDLRTAGRHREAIEKWHTVYRNQFPSYG